MNNSSLYNKKIRNIYDHIFYQIQNIPKFDESILNIIEENIIAFNKDIIYMYFNGQIEDVFMTILTEDDDLIKIINDPKEFYTTKIKAKYKEIKEKLIESQEYKKLIEFYKGEQSLENNNANNSNNNEESKAFITYYNVLKNEIEEQLKKIDEDYKDLLNKQNQKAFDERIKNIDISIEKLNKIYEDLDKISKGEDILDEEISNQKGSDVEEDESVKKGLLFYKIFKQLINDYNKNIIVQPESKDFIKSSQKKELIKYACVEINLEKIKGVYQEEIYQNKIYSQEIEVLMNTKRLNEICLPIDLTSNKKERLYICNEDNIPLSKLITITSNNEEIKLDIQSLTKYWKEIYFNKNNYVYKRKIIIDIKEKIIFKFEKIEKKEEYIRKEIIKSSSKDDNRKTLFFGQQKIVKKAELYKMLEKFNKNNINFMKIINEIITKEKINYKDILKSIKSLSQEQAEISEYLKCNCSDSTHYEKISQKLEDIQNYFKQLLSLFKNFDSYIRANVKAFMEAYNKAENLISSMLKNIKIKSPISIYKPKININTINPDSNHLLTLIISEESGKVFCSQSELLNDFGLYVSSLIKGDFSVYILSIINQKLFASKSFNKIDNAT